MASVPVEDSVTALHAVPELAFVPASIGPPEGSPSVSFALHELAFVKVGFLARPLVEPSPILLIEFELPYVVIST